MKQGQSSIKGDGWRLDLTAFILPVLAYLAMLVIEGFAPFGDRSLFIMDMSDQYVEFLCGLKSGDIAFSWSKALGTDYIGVFAYYVSSPFSVLTLLFPNRLMHYGVLVLTAVKLGCASLTSRRFFSRCCGARGASGLIFSLAYSLSAYCIAYSMCVMWLDGVIWLPVILLGIERILRGESPVLFLASLCVCLVSTYYISYMIVLFSCLYFVMRCVEEREGRFIRKALVFAGAGILAAGLAAVFLVPTFLSHFEGKLVSAQQDYASSTNFSFPALADKLLFGGYDSITNKGTPSVYCGILTVWFGLSFFAREGIAPREKLCRGALLAILAVSLWYSPLDKVWHVFQYPNWFPYRYAFLFSFALICMAARSYAAKGFDARRGVTAALLIVMLLDLSWGGVRLLRGLDGEFGYDDEAEYVYFRREKEALLSGISDDGFFRVRSSVDRSKNDAIGFDYNGTTHYSSAYLSSVNQWVHSFGMGQGWIWCSDYGSTPVTDLFLDIEYAVSDSVPGPFYTLVTGNTLGGLYRSSYAGSLGWFVPAGREDWEDAYDPFDDQNRLFRMLSGEESVYTQAEAEEVRETDGARFTLVSDGEPLFGWFPKQNGSASLYVNGRYICELYKGETDCIWYLGTYPAGEGVEVCVAAEWAEATFRSLDTEAFARGASALNALELLSVSDGGRVKARINCPSDGMILTSIPAASGWTVKVDGEAVETGTALGTFLSIPVTAGSHSITMGYAPPGTGAGLGITVLSAALILGGWLFYRRKNRKLPVDNGETGAYN